ncbi:MAG: O-antigen ligase family protein [Candidatus Brocadiae bacterium]|nr:O-antigen ligase family protein [Candidatus Brocadiia bacterium]
MIEQIAFSLLLFFLPLASSSVFTNQDIPKQFLLVLLVTIAGYCFFHSQKKEKSVDVILSFGNILWFSFWVLLVLSSFFTTYWHNGWDRISHWLVVFFLYTFAPSWSNSRFSRNAQILLTAGVLSAIYGIYQFFHLESVHAYSAHVSTFGNTNLSANVMVLLLLLALSLPQKKSFFALCQKISWGVLFFYLILTGSRAGWLSFSLGILCYALLFLFSQDRLPWKKILLSSILAAAILMMPFLFSSIRTTFLLQCKNLAHWDTGSGKVRYLIWQSTGAMIADHPFLGSGLGQFPSRYPYYRSDEEYILSEGRLVEHPHNEWLWIACESGVFSACCILGIVLIALFSLLALLKSQDMQKRKEARALISMLVAFVTLSLFSFPLASASSLYFFAMITGYAQPPGKKISIQKNFLHILFFLVTMLLFLTAFCSMLANVFFMAGQKNLLVKEYQSARQSFDIASFLYPRALYGVEIGRSYLAMGDYGLAAKKFQDILEIAPELENAAIDLGLAHCLYGNHEKALKVWQNAKNLFPLSTILHYNMVQLFWQTNHPEKALECLKHLPSKNYRLAQDWNYILYMGEAYQKIGNLRKAFSFYIKAKETAPEKAMPYLKIAFFMESLNLYDAAIYHLSEAMRLGSKEEKILAACSLGKLYEKEKKYQNAALYYLKAKQENPKNPRIYLHIAQISLHLGKEEFALENLKKAKAHGFRDWKILGKEEFFYPLISSRIYKDFENF